MKSNRIVIKFAPVALALLYAATMASAQHIRGTSETGEDSNAPNWLLLGRSHDLMIANNGKSATLRREIICLNQDVEDSLPSPTLTLSGGCDGGGYMWLFQFQSSAANMAITIKALVGFNPADATSFGEMICDSSTNTIEMCSNTTSNNIPNITATTTAKSVTFTVPNTFPSYPAGTAQQGQGLTFFVITHQPAPNQLPIGAPQVGIK